MNEETKKRISQSLKGRKFTEEHKRNLSLSHKGNKPSKETIRKRSETLRKGYLNGWKPFWLGKTFSKEHKIKISEGNKKSYLNGREPYWKGKKQSKEHIRKSLMRRNKTSLESKFEEIINKLNLPYIFVGNGNFFIEKKNPDFINTNGEKIAIEVFYRGFKIKKCFHNYNLEEWKKQRQQIFNNYGWKIEFFDETQVNEEEVKKRLI